MPEPLCNFLLFTIIGIVPRTSTPYIFFTHNYRNLLRGVVLILFYSYI
nr:MAG TPA: Replicase polyprotein 1a [Bacteriophage sp.]